MKIKKLAADWLATIRRQDDKGHEVPDPNPLAIPAGFRRPETLAEQVRRLIRTDPSLIAGSDEVETFDDANDFDIGDDFDPSSPWETVYDPELGREISPAEYQEHAPQIREELAAKLRNLYRLEEVERHEMAFLERARGSKGDPPSQAPKAPKEPPAEQ